MPRSLYTETPPIVTSRISPTAPERSVTSLAAMPYVGVWKREPKPDTPDELTKVPYNPRTGRKALPNKPGTFGTRQQAETALASGEYAGLCFLIADDLGVTAGDLDHIVPEDRAFDETAIPADVRRLIRVANTYASWSPSGTGLRFYFAAVVPGYKTRASINAPIHAEAYSRSRFMTETFRRISGTPDTFTTDPGDLAAWLTLLGFEHNAPAVRTTLAVAPSLTVDDADVIERLRRTSDPTFSRLFDAGDLTEHDGDASRADLSLMNLIAWASGDPVQTERLFDASALGQRAKWTGRPDYRASTISKAFEGRTSYYQPAVGALPDHKPEPEPEPLPHDACGDVTALLWRMVITQAGTITTLRERLHRADARRDIARNRKLGSASTVASVLPDVLGAMRPRNPGSATPYRLPLGRLADETGQSTDTCSRQLHRLARYTAPDGAPIIRVKVKDIPRSVDPDTGEITAPHNETWVGADLNPRALADVLAALDPDNAPKHGGRPDRNVCPNHPNAGVVRRERTLRRVVHECAQCRQVLDAHTIPVGRERIDILPFIGAEDAEKHHAEGTEKMMLRGRTPPTQTPSQLPRIMPEHLTTTLLMISPA